MEKEIKEKIDCAICGEKFPIITPSHLMRKHKISLAEYKEKFPDAPITSSQYKAKQKFLKGNLFVKEQQEPIIDEIDLTKLTLETEAKVDTEIDAQIETIKASPIKQLSEDIAPTPPASTRIARKREANVLVTRVEIKKSDVFRSAPQIADTKLRIIDFLKTVFPPNSVVNNFMIEKFQQGLLQYQIITDIAIPSKKIDLEFTKTFWHNSPVPDVHRRHKLERDGWTVIEILDLAPSIDVVKKYLKNRRLI